MGLYMEDTQGCGGTEAVAYWGPGQELIQWAGQALWMAFSLLLTLLKTGVAQTSTSSESEDCLQQ
jgi:hypothetical protein